MSTTISPISLAKKAYTSEKRKSPELCDSIQETAKKWHVPRRTLGDRLSGKTTLRMAANQAMQRLSVAEEVSLCQFIQTMGLGGFPPSVGMVKRMAEEIVCYCNGREFDPHAYIPPFGINWMAKFKARNPQVKAMYTRAREVKRTEAVRPENVQPFYAALRKVRQHYRHPASAIYNMDKTGFAIGNVQRRKGVIYRDSHGSGPKAQALQAKQARGEWVTSIECISAEGKALNPLVIFKGKAVNQSWMLGEADRARTKGWEYAASTKGWSSNELGYQWLVDVFHPQTDLGYGKRRLLILDGHGSHLSARFCRFCWEKNIDLVVLPPHTLHVLQPLDVGVFKELKRVICRAAESRWRLLAEGDRLSKRDFLLDLAEAREQAMRPEYITKGWEATGLWPLNTDKVAPFPHPHTPAALSPLSACRRLQTTESLESQWQDALAEHPDLPSPIKRLALQSAEKHTIDRTDKLMLDKQLSEQKEQLTKLQRQGKPAKRRAVKNPTPGSFIVSGFWMVRDMEKAEEARKAKEAGKGKGRGKGKGKAVVSAVSADPAVPLWDKDVFGAFGDIDYVSRGAAAAVETADSDDGESETETEGDSEDESQ